MTAKTTTTTTTSAAGRRATATTTKRKTTRRRRKARRRRTYVVEYDVDSFDKKFSIKTTKKVIRRRRKTKRKSGSRRGRCTSRRGTGAGNEADSAAAESVSRRSIIRSIEANYPKLHLFGDKNALEYFPDDESENDDAQPNLSSFGGGIDSGGGRGEAMVMSSARFAIGHRGLLKGKQMGAVRRRRPTATATSENMSSTDILSDILGTMDRWYSMSKADNIEKIKIGADGKLSMDEKKPPAMPNSSAVVNAPRNAPANEDNVQVGSSSGSCVNNGNGGSSNEASNGNGNECTSSTSNETSVSGNVCQSSGGGGSGEADSSGSGNIGPDLPDSNVEEPRRIMTRRRSKSSQLAPPPSLDEFPALNSEIDGLDLTINSSSISNSGQLVTPNRVSARRKSTLAPPPSIDMFPALSSPSFSTITQAGRIDLRRKSTLAPPPSLEGFPALAAIDENFASISQSNYVNEVTPRRIMTRRRSNLAPSPSFDNNPIESNQQPSRIMTRRRSRTLDASPAISGFSVPPPPISHPITELLSQPPPISNYSPRIQSQPVTPISTFGPQLPSFYMGVSPFASNYAVPQPVPAPIPQMVPPIPSPATNDAPLKFSSPSTRNADAQLASTAAAGAADVPSTPTPINRNHKPTKIAWKNSNAFKKKSVFNTSDDEDGGFQYSAESLEVAIKKQDAQNEENTGAAEESTSEATVSHMERDEDLVQLDDDEEAASTEQTIVEKSNEDADQSLAAKKNILDLHDDSDWEELHGDQLTDNAPGQEKDVEEGGEITADKEEDPVAAAVGDDEGDGKNDDDTAEPEVASGESGESGDATAETETNRESGDSNEPTVEPVPRSYTPCLDEQQVVQESAAAATGSNADKTAGDGNESTYTPDLTEHPGRISAGIDNMETELISDDDDDDLLGDGPNNRKDSNAKRSGKQRKRRASSREREQDEEFRKISKSTRERRYRGNRQSPSRSRSPVRRRRGTRSLSRSLSRSRSKSRSRSRPRNSRSWSRGRRNNNNGVGRNRRPSNNQPRNGRNANKRREIQRYNVRNVVADRKDRRHQKDQYGRDEAR